MRPFLEKLLAWPVLTQNLRERFFVTCNYPRITNETIAWFDLSFMRNMTSILSQNLFPWKTENPEYHMQ